MSPAGKYRYAMPSARSPRLSRWATLAFTPPLVVGLSISLCAVFASDEHTLRAILSILPAQLFIFPFAFAYCVLPATALKWLFENKAVRRPIATKRTAFALCGSILGLLFSPPTWQRALSLSIESTELDWLLIITGPLAGALSAWIVFPKYEASAP